MTSRELVDAAIARIELLNPALNAVIIPLFDKARAVATALMAGFDTESTPSTGRSAASRSC